MVAHAGVSQKSVLAARLLLGLLTVGAAGAARADACSVGGEERATVSTVEPRLELRLGDGRRLRLAGVDPAMPTPDRPDLDETTRRALATRIVGKAVSLRLLSGKPDRWGRLPALVFEDGTDETGGLAGFVVAQGLARTLVEPVAGACREAMLAREAKARSAKLGLWADPYYGVLAVDDRAAFVERSGTLVLAEGRLRKVETSPYRTTLHFTAPGRAYQGGRMLVATIPPRAMKAFRAAQVDVGALVGQRVRVRGLLDLHFGPQIELAGPDALERFDAVPGTAPSPPD